MNMYFLNFERKSIFNLWLYPVHDLWIRS